MAEPITSLAAIGLADNALSFLQLGIKMTREAYSSIDGLPNELSDAHDLAQKLQTTNESLQEGLASFNAVEKGDLSRADRVLIDISSNWQSVAHDFIEILEEYKAPPDGRLKVARTAIKAIRAAWNRDKLKGVENLLDVIPQST